MFSVGEKCSPCWSPGKTDVRRYRISISVCKALIVRVNIISGNTSFSVIISHHYGNHLIKSTQQLGQVSGSCTAAIDSLWCKLQIKTSENEVGWKELQLESVVRVCWFWWHFYLRNIEINYFSFLFNFDTVRIFHFDEVKKSFILMYLLNFMQSRLILILWYEYTLYGIKMCCYRNQIWHFHFSPKMDISAQIWNFWVGTSFFLTSCRGKYI